MNITGSGGTGVTFVLNIEWVVINTQFKTQTFTQIRWERNHWL